MTNTIIIEGIINGEVARRVSHINKPYANFTIKVIPENDPSFYCRCYIDSNHYSEMDGVAQGDKIRIYGSIKSTMFPEGNYGKQIEVSKVEKLTVEA